MSSFVNFIDPHSFVQIDLLIHMHEILKSTKTNFLVFLKKSEEDIYDNFLNRVDSILSDIIIITEEFEKHKSIFNAPVCCESVLIFDEKMQLIASELSQNLVEQKSINLFLKTLAAQRILLQSFIRVGFNLNEYGLFKKIVDENGQYDLFVISMFNSICHDCRSGSLVNKLKQKYEALKNTHYFMVILTEDFTRDDINNLQQALDITIPIAKADSLLMKNWRYHTDETGELLLNNIVFIMNSNLEVLAVLNPNNPEDFFCKIE